MEVITLANGIFLNQQKYILDMLEKFELQEAKPVSTLMTNTITLKLDDGSAEVDATKYRQVIGSLQYLSMTRSDISFSVNKLAQFMHCPTENHWTSLKRVLRYLKGTSGYGLVIKKTSSINITAFSDADWGVIVTTKLQLRAISFI